MPAGLAKGVLQASGIGGMALDVITGGANVAQAISDITPKLEDEVTVEVVGQPGSTKRQLYYLAMSAAYGLARPALLARWLKQPPSLMMCEYDAADAWVRFTLKYKTGVFNFIQNAIFTPSIIGELATSTGMVVVNGPSDTLKGASAVIPLQGNLAPILNPAFLGAVPLPFSNKIILTSSGICENPDPNAAGGGQTVIAPNPRPPGDTRSRGAVQNPYSSEVVADYLIPMIFASLSDPGSMNGMFVPPPVPGPGQAGNR